MLCIGKCCKQSVCLLMYLKRSFYLVVATYQIQIKKAYLKLFINIFIKLKGFHLVTNTISRHNWNYFALRIEIVYCFSYSTTLFILKANNMQFFLSFLPFIFLIFSFLLSFLYSFLAAILCNKYVYPEYLTVLIR